MGLAGFAEPAGVLGVGRTARLLVGSLAHSAKWRGWLSRCTEQPHLVEGLDRVVRALSGVTRSWRFDRMATVCDPRAGLALLLPGWPSTTGPRWPYAPPGAATVKAWWRRRISLRRNAGGARWA